MLQEFVLTMMRFGRSKALKGVERIPGTACYVNLSLFDSNPVCLPHALRALCVACCVYLRCL